MRVLLDESLPRKLKFRLLPEHEASTVQENGWSGLGNGALLRVAESSFDTFLTADRGIEYQQAIGDLSISVIVLRAISNQYHDILPLVPSIRAALDHLKPGQVIQLAR